MSVDDMFCYSVATVVQNADISDFEEKEIRCLAVENPLLIKEMSNWHGKLKRKTPEQNDLGMDKNRAMYIFRSGEWRSI